MSGVVLDTAVEFVDGAELPFSKVDAFLREFVYGKQEGEHIPNPLFVIGRLPAATVEAAARFIPGLSGSNATVRVSGHSLKHTDERRHEALKKIAAQLPRIIHAGGEVMRNPARPNSAFLLYEDGANYFLILELERTKAGTTLVNLITTTKASVRKNREKTNAWLAARSHLQHPNLPPEGTHAVSEFSDVQPSTDSILPQSDDIAQIFEESTDGALPVSDTLQFASIFEFSDASSALDTAAAVANTAFPEFATSRTIGDSRGQLFDGIEYDLFTLPSLDGISDQLEAFHLASELGSLATTYLALKSSQEVDDKLAVLKVAARAREIHVQLRNMGPTPTPAPEGEVSSSPDDDLSDDPASPNYRYGDTGYIADSRKEKAADTIMIARKTGQRLRGTDLDWKAIEQNPRLAADLITKSNLFGKTDWSSLEARGMTSAAGFLIDKVFASIGPAPETDGALSRKDYAFGLETIRDRLESLVTASEVVAVLNDIRAELTGVQLTSEEGEAYQLASEQMEQVRIQYRYWNDFANGAYSDAQLARSAHYQAEHLIGTRKNRGWAIKEEHIDAERDTKVNADALWKIWSEKVNEAKPNKDIAALEIARLRNEIEDLKSAAKSRNIAASPTTRAWLTFGQRFFKLLHFRTFKGSDSFAGHVTNALTGRVKDWGWADKERPAGVRGATKQEINFQMRVADSYERVGGAPVEVNSTQALKDSLGFRDVQSGNWVLRDANSAKFHVEQTAGAMSDLADMLQVDKGLIGFGGRLGMAFGARGSGGKNAARAHYEPVLRVINLTKMGGGGSLGHEYWHSLDNMLHELANAEVASKKTDFASVNPDLLPAGELRDAMHAVQRSILDGTNRAPETFKFTEKDIRLAKYNIGQPRNNISRAIKAAGNAADAVLSVDQTYPVASATSPKSVKMRNQWRRLAAAYYAEADAVAATLPVGNFVSDFAAEATKLDNGQLGAYWSQIEELSARAFQAWVEDTMAAQQRKNDYLSAFADNKFHVDAILGIQYKPFPEGEERTRINAAFDSLFEKIRSAQVFEKANENRELLDAVFGIS